MTELLPHFFADERADAGENLGEALNIRTIDGLGFVDVIDEDHHGADGGIEGQGFIVLGALLDHRVIGEIKLAAILIGDAGDECFLID